MNLKIIENKNTKMLEVTIDNINYGAFDQVDKGGKFAFFPKRNDQLTGDHYLLIGAALNQLNESAPSV